MLCKKPTESAAETVQPAADTGTAAVEPEGETLVETANASRSPQVMTLVAQEYRYEAIQEKCCIRTGTALGVSAAHLKPGC